MAEEGSSAEARLQGSIRVSEERMEAEHVSVDGGLGKKTWTYADDAGVDKVMNAGGECADKGGDDDWAQSVGVPQGVGNGGC